MITLIVKGRTEDASRAVNAHRITGAVAVRENGNYPETIFTVPDACEEIARQWFNEAPLAAPFPPGSLLWFGSAR